MKDDHEKHPWEGIRIRAHDKREILTLEAPAPYASTIGAVSESGERVVIPLSQLTHILGIEPIWHAAE